MKRAARIATRANGLAPCAAGLLAVAVMGVTALSRPAHGATWNGGSAAGNNWTDPLNWGGTAPIAADPLIFAGATRLAATNDFAAGTQFNGITFNPNAGAFVLGGNSINLQGDVVNNATTGQSLTLSMVLTQNTSFTAAAGALIISGAITGPASAATLNLNGSATAVSTVSGIIADGASPLSITVTGTNTWALTGGNTFTGNVSVTGGTLRASDFIGLPGNSLLTINGGVFETDNLSRAFASTAGSVRVTGGVSGFSANGGGAVTIGNFGSVVWGDPNFNPTTLVLQVATANQPLNFTNNIDLSNAVRSITVNNNSATNIANINGNITDSGSAGGLTKIGTGVLALNGTNIYNGNTTISAGVLRASDGLSLPATSLLILNGGAFETAGGSFIRDLGTSPGQVQIPAGVSGFSANNGSLNVNIGNAGANLVWGGANFNPGTLTLQATSANTPLFLLNGVDFNGAVRAIGVNSTAASAGAFTNAALIDSGVGGGLNKVGAGWLIVQAVASTYAGPTTVAGGVLRADDAFGLPTASALTLNGGLLETQANFTRNLGTAAGQVQIPGGASGFSANGPGPVTINLNSNATLVWGTPTFNPGTLSLQAASGNQPLILANGLDLAGATRTVSVAANVATITGAIINSGTSGGFTKAGAGSLILNQTNTYTGNTTLTAGNLQLGDGITNGSVAGNIILTAGTLIVLPTGNVNLPGNITGAGAVNIPFTTPTTSTVTLSGNNTYTGNLTVSNGTFVLNSTTNTGGAAGIFIVNASSPTGQSVVLLSTGPAKTITKVFQVGGAQANPFGVTFTGNASVTFNSTSASFTATAANVYINNNLSGNAVLTFSGPFEMSNNTGNRNVRMTGSGTTIITGAMVDSISNPTTVNSVLIRDNSTVSSITGITILNSTSLGYHGGTQIVAGTIIFNVPGTLPSQTLQGSATASTYIRVSSGGAVGYAGGITNPAFLALLANTNVINIGATTNSFATGSLAIVSNADATQNIDFTSAPATGSSWSNMALGAANGSFTYSGVLTPLGQTWRLGGGNGALTFNQALIDMNGSTSTLTVLGGGGGTLILGSTGNTYTGNTTLNANQTLKNGVNNALPVTTLLSVAGTYDLNGFNQTLNGFSGAGVITSSAGPSTLYFDFTSTTNTFTGSYTGNVGLGLAGTGTYTLTNPSTMTGPSSVPAGVTLLLVNSSSSTGTIAGLGTTEVSSGVTLTANSISTASLLIDSTAAVTIRQNNSTPSVITTLTLAGATNAWTAKLDLANNNMIVSGPGGSNIPNQLKNASNLGAWTGTSGITSSRAQAAATSSTATSLAYATGTQFKANNGQTTFAGQPFNPTDMLVMYTLAGDANMDKSVTFADFLQLQNHYNQAGTDWEGGDWNYDGSTTFADFLILQNNYNKVLSASSVGTASAGAVPEPASLALLSLALPLVFRRRPKRC